MKFPFSLLFAFLLLGINLGCTQENGSGNQQDNGKIVLKEAFPQLSFIRPVDFQHAGDDSNRVFVVEQRGVISVFENDSTTENKDIFLDIEDQVEDGGNEQGLLGLAFHPDFESNGYFYVNYTASNPDRTVISRYQVSSTDENKADSATELVVLEFDQPYANHNGGQLSFGPDGYLYIAVGDGGSGGDPQGHGQNLGTLLGTILRIAVDGSQDGNNYSIPTDNPFVDNTDGFRKEIYAYGLRNPWRFSFDAENGNLWTGDVGQNRYEEINMIEKGGNYGWNIMEASHCFKPENGCEQEGLKMPVWEYDRTQGDISITGGFVYRGPSIEKLQGLYLYADYVTGRIWTLDVSGGGTPNNELLVRGDFPISSFGVDQQDELFVCGFDGKIYRFGY